MTDYYQLDLDDMVIALNTKDVDIELLQKKLDIAVKALEEISHWGPWKNERDERAMQALKEIDLVGTSVSLTKEEE